ncbi:hypothetical protein P153DRAFT_298727 [Dothidotthia symphoricarpi CBS 119687]|uniref:Indole-diterpene biosynthesis protein-like protein PaxU n=1 Tax=Dothidotthia symphoricarpi CBS 119687 TaxID=1392245 RepID=A0A6A6A5M8_9PLEO|nr:uncharacterized protein P153DRAFT_298727 [Dothidotthia symphoricarpi CBS 119687]KAF2126078.1 hypothetical protein P153DRAFT_298727 [Dothidotthia symphoricarpi CBS 119687]
MEPSITPPPTTISKPLSEFQTVGHNTYLWTPPTTKATTKPPFILLFSWNAAAAKHIAKYTFSYQTRFPTSQILLIRCETADIFRHTTSSAKLLQPAIEIVSSHTQDGGEVLVHSFSNGGGNQVNEFAKAWKRRFGTMMPMRCHIMDSSPTKGPWMKSHAAIAASLPKTWGWRMFGGVLVHLLLVLTFVTNVVMWKENKMVVLCREINDEQVFDRSVPRVYLYSRTDQMVGWEEVEEHAAIAKRKGFDVTMVRFEKSAHCGHVREDEGKYWDAVLEAWKAGPGER